MLCQDFTKVLHHCSFFIQQAPGVNWFLNIRLELSFPCPVLAGVSWLLNLIMLYFATREIYDLMHYVG